MGSVIYTGGIRPGVIAHTSAGEVYCPYNQAVTVPDIDLAGLLAGPFSAGDGASQAYVPPTPHTYKLPLVRDDGVVVDSALSPLVVVSVAAADRAYTGRASAASSLAPAASLLPDPVDLTDAADFFIDSVNGVDTNDGRSRSTAWKTLAKITTGNGVAAGSIIALKCGSEFREVLPFPITGTNTARIVYGQYGSGTRPKIKGSKDYGSANTFTTVGGGVYSMPAAALPASPNIVYIDEDLPLAKSATQGAMTAGSYFADVAGSVLYVWLPDGSSPTGRRVEVNGVTSTIANTGAMGYVTVQDLQLMHGHGGNCGLFSASTSRGVVVRRNKIGPHFGAGVYVGSPGMIVEDNYVYNCWDAIEYPATAGSGVGITGGTANITGSEIRRNRVTGCTHGIRLVSGADATIHHNIVYLNHVNGIDAYSGTTDKIRVYNNTIWHRPTSTAGHAIDQQAGADGYTSRNNLVYCDFTGDNTNSELFTLASGTSAKTSEDYSLGYATPASTAAPGKVSTTQYATWAAYVAAAQAAYGAGNYVHSIYGQDPRFQNLAARDFRLLSGSPALNAGVALSPYTDGFTGAAPNIGAL